MEDKLILVYYINVKGLSPQRAKQALYDIQENLTNSEYKNIVIPVTEHDNYIECINPKLISNEEYNYVLEIVNDAQEKLDKFLKIK